MSKILGTYAAILRELRKALPQGAYKTDPSVKFIVQQHQQFQMTPDKICRNSKAASHQAATYLCYLESNRLYQELLEFYHQRGERSIEESAKLVGLKLPETPKD